MIESKTKDELNRIAEDLHAGRIFCDRHCERVEDVRSVFMIIALMDREQLQQLGEDGVGLVYEYLDRAGPISVNGLPTFLSMKLLNRDDTEYVIDRVEKIKQALAAI